MHIQGNLQTVFDVLYNLGVIDPVLKMDWSEAMAETDEEHTELRQAVMIVNRNQGNAEKLHEELKKLDTKTLEFLAMEVAREYADYHSRESLQ